MENLTSIEPCDPGFHTIMAALELQLAALDRIGAHIAAAHVDAAIQQLRLDQVRAEYVSFPSSKETPAYLPVKPAQDQSPKPSDK